MNYYPLKGGLAASYATVLYSHLAPHRFRPRKLLALRREKGDVLLTGPVASVFPETPDEKSSVARVKRCSILAASVLYCTAVLAAAPRGTLYKITKREKER